MNMIMHGDGHGGIHYHDGFVDINGIFPGRFDVVLTNPPFGANVGEDQKFGASEQTRLPDDRDYLRRCRERYGQAWQEAHNHTAKAIKDAIPILEAYEIGKDKPNRPTELLFIERCISLLRPGGRLGIVLPDGNLNNPSLSWLRRWAEGKTKLLAIVSLPEATFASADATVKASLVFLQKFTTDDQSAWDAAWEAAHVKHDRKFHACRVRLCTEYGPRIACADDPQLAEILKNLRGLGVYRSLPDWKPKSPPPYPAGVVQTEVSKPKWHGKPTDAKKARVLRQQFDRLWSEQFEERANELMRDLRQALRKVDREHTRALWQHVREALDYPVFTAAPETVGITSTGAEGPNELPKVLDAYRQFRAWLEAGAQPSEEPKF